MLLESVYLRNLVLVSFGGYDKARLGQLKYLKRDFYSDVYIILNRIELKYGPNAH